MKQPEEETGRDIYINNFLKKVPAEGLVDMILSDNFPESEKNKAKERLAEILRNKYSGSRIKIQLVDSMITATFVDKEKFPDFFKEHLKFVSLQGIIKSLAGAIAYKEESKIVQIFWEIVKGKIKEYLIGEKNFQEEDIKLLYQLYIVLGGNKFLKEVEVIQKIEERIKNY